jgi:hypothetical protein
MPGRSVLALPGCDIAGRFRSSDEGQSDALTFEPTKTLSARTIEAPNTVFEALFRRRRPCAIQGVSTQPIG